MSHEVNTRLFEEAAEIIDEGYINKYDLNTLEQAIHDADLEMIYEIITRYRHSERELGDDF